MDWWKRLFDVDLLLPMVGGLVAGGVWLVLATQESGANTVSVGGATVGLPQLGASCVCFVLSGALAVARLRDDDPDECLP
jgi:hypothetical protein